MTDLWVSVDVEASGPTPSAGSLLQIGACLVDRPEEGFQALLQPLPDRSWSDDAERIHRLSRARLERDGLTPRDAMAAFDAWLTEQAAGASPLFVAFNATFDWMWVADYFHRFLGRNPFGISGLDLKAYAMGRLDLADWQETRKDRLRSRFPTSLPHTHDALDDAREQADLARQLRATASGGTGPA